MIGQTISQYTIIEKLGEGGMGVVYKAQDNKLDRFVALKFLPPHLAASERDKARFIQEAKSAAALNHPNICSIIDIQEHDQQIFIVMEFVDGQTLLEKKSSVTQKQAIDYAIQIADGLAAAHEKGIVHRDIKPENIMIRKDGIVQVMDFGLAKLVGVSRLTKVGSTVGTLGYMSPEQVQGQETDHRSDIFSFGVLLYEMITGKSPFNGAHESAILYEIVNVDVPPPSAVKQEIDPELDRIVMECMEKDSNERMQSMKQIAIDLNRFKRTSSRTRMSRSFPVRVSSDAVQLPVRTGYSKRIVKEYLPWIVTGLALIVMIGMYVFLPIEKNSIHSIVNASIVLPDSIRPLFFGGGSAPLISPDGRRIAVIEALNGQIVVYSLEDKSLIRLRNTEGSQHPFWAPDGKNIGFFSNNRLKRTDLSGGSPVTICLAINPRGGSWSIHDQIIFTEDYQAPILLVSANGGEPKQITTLDSIRKEGSHRYPYFLPDGKHFLYFNRTISESGEAEGDAIYAGSVDGTVKKMVVRSSTNAMYANGHIVFLQNRTVMAQRFNTNDLELEGDPFVIDADVINDFSWNLAMYSVSQNGILLTQHGQLSSGAPILIYSMDGKLIRSVGGMDEMNAPKFSPDGNKMAVWLYDTKSRKTNIWILDLRTGSKSRLTNGKEGEFNPVWSPDGTRIVFSVDNRAGILYETFANRTSERKKYFQTKDILQALDWSRDGRKILMQKSNPQLNNSDIGWIDADAKDSLHLLVASQYDEVDGRISPDEKWLSYASNESGDYDLYIYSLKDSQTWKVEDNVANGGRWGATTNELFYVKNDGMLVRASIVFSKEGISHISKKNLFTVPLTSINSDVSRDGKSIAFIRAFEAQGLTYPPISMKLFWYETKKDE
ncbi:MAG: protein kinase [Bacteroidota bacterium]